jgi:uncharacterized alpha-E superfamily protein
MTFMLARTADNLFWLARSMERADYIARTIEATLRLEYLPKTDSEQVGEWEGALSAAGAYVSFVERHGDRIPDIRPREPVLDSQLPGECARRGTRRAHSAHRRDLDGDQRRLA